MPRPTRMWRTGRGSLLSAGLTTTRTSRLCSSLQGRIQMPRIRVAAQPSTRLQSWGVWRLHGCCWTLGPTQIRETRSRPRPCTTPAPSAWTPSWSACWPRAPTSARPTTAATHRCTTRVAAATRPCVGCCWRPRPTTPRRAQRAGLPFSVPRRRNRQRRHMFCVRHRLPESRGRDCASFARFIGCVGLREVDFSKGAWQAWRSIYR
mmetsp:Transcript_83460/g.239736  ORF Transcript_83460/g.239736 Transcript_83460/m.239736 type:complete len:206 (+) Transcript_83460:225-842(+)